LSLGCNFGEKFWVHANERGPFVVFFDFQNSLLFAKHGKEAITEVGRNFAECSLLVAEEEGGRSRGIANSFGSRVLPLECQNSVDVAISACRKEYDEGSRQKEAPISEDTVEIWFSV
jgi:hypothetical protein